MRLGVAAVCCCILLACSSARAGRHRDEAPQRIVSLAPSTTEALFAIGAGSLVVGVSRYCDYPPEARRLPKVGGFVDPSLEAILGLDPDLVVGARAPSNRGVVERLVASGIDVYFPPSESLRDVRAMLVGLGRRAHRTEQAARVLARIDRDLAEIARAVRGRPRPRVLFVIGRHPLAVAGPSSFAGELVELAGGVNVVRRGGAYPTLGLERVLELAPDVVIESGHGETGPAIDWTRLATVPAVRDHRIERVDDVRIIRPGPRIAGGVAALARVLHPGTIQPQ